MKSFNKATLHQYRLYDMRNDITHEGYTTELLTQQYIEKTIEESRAFLMTVEKA